MKKIVLLVACVVLVVLSASGTTAAHGWGWGHGVVAVGATCDASAPVAMSVGVRPVRVATPWAWSPWVPRVQVTSVPSAPVTMEAGTKAYSRTSFLGRYILLEENPTVTVGGAKYENRRGPLGVPRWRSAN